MAGKLRTFNRGEIDEELLHGVTDDFGEAMGEACRRGSVVHPKQLKSEGIVSTFRLYMKFCV